MLMCESQGIFWGDNRCDRLPSLINELYEGQPGILLNGVLPLLQVEDTSKLLSFYTDEVHVLEI